MTKVEHNEMSFMKLSNPISKETLDGISPINIRTFVKNIGLNALGNSGVSDDKDNIYPFYLKNHTPELFKHIINKSKADFLVLHEVYINSVLPFITTPNLMNETNKSLNVLASHQSKRQYLGDSLYKTHTTIQTHKNPNIIFNKKFNIDILRHIFITEDDVKSRDEQNKNKSSYNPELLQLKGLTQKQINIMIENTNDFKKDDIIILRRNLCKLVDKKNDFFPFQHFQPNFYNLGPNKMLAVINVHSDSVILKEIKHNITKDRINKYLLMIEVLFNYIKQLITQNIDIVVAGDFNINNKFKTSNGGQVVVDTLISNVKKLGLHLIIHNHVCIITSNHIHIDKLSIVPPLGRNNETNIEQTTEHFGYIYDLQIYPEHIKFNSIIIDLNIEYNDELRKSLLSNQEFWKSNDDKFFGESCVYNIVEKPKLDTSYQPKRTQQTSVSYNSSKSLWRKQN
jgi:hypothetical protein